eukprot:TRINITY_DN1642_c0_g1_i2.p1 TRINITY_DN1642_c0_g1~~TRINITY_DN1642_c0_g1_i2.p1  ORF type:complete len:318 (-),score=92.35 TRINITY_DN1642_c0_g1_i2:284-1237(-)
MQGGSFFKNSHPFGAWSEIKVKVLSYAVQDMDFSSHPYAEYRIEITKGNNKWFVHKRYNQLLAFHKWIVRNHMVDTKILPPFPEAPLFDKVLKEYEEVAEERKFLIEGYLEYLINVDEVYNSRPAQVFYEFGNLIAPENRKNVLVALPSQAFELAQVSIVWKVLTALGNNVVFATENGKKAQHEEVQYEPGNGIPEAKRFYFDLLKEQSFKEPISFKEITPGSFSGVVLVGGFIPSAIVDYLDSPKLQSKVRKFWNIGVPVGAISHGILVLCRAKDKEAGRSLIWKSNSTSLQKYVEKVCVSSFSFLSAPFLFADSS